MKPTVTFPPERLEYLRLLARHYPNVQAACTEIINLRAIQNLPRAPNTSCPTSTGSTRPSNTSSTPPPAWCG